MKLTVAILTFLCLSLNLSAQIKGKVFDQALRKPIDQVAVFNLTNKTSTFTNPNGDFNLIGKMNDLLAFSMPGYQPDTLFLINLKPFIKYLQMEVNTLNTVNVNSKTLREQYAQTFNKANAVLLAPGRGLLFYPSAYFIKEGKRARKLKRMIKQEEIDLQIDKKFNPKIVTSILPLKQPELDAFMVRYRPTLKAINQKSDDDFKFFLYDAYEKFKLLPVNQRILPSLKIDSLHN